MCLLALILVADGFFTNLDSGKEGEVDGLAESRSEVDQNNVDG